MPQYDPLNEGRSLNPGDTRPRDRARPRAAGTLNEGRSLNPGDTQALDDDQVLLHLRSTKAGV